MPGTADPERLWLLAPDSKPSAQSPTSRVEQLDLMKAIAIVFVVLEHSMRSTLFVDDATKWESFTGEASSVCTPVFLFASGFLGHQALSYDMGDYRSVLHRCQHAASVILRCLNRLLIPYVVSTFVILFYDAVYTGTKPSYAWCQSSLFQILTFKVLGLHYYVCLAVSCTLLLPAVAWACANCRVGFLLFLTLLLARVYSTQYFVELGVSLTVQLRVPTFGLPYYVFGYLTRAHIYERILATSTATRFLISVVLVTCCVPWLADVPYLYDNGVQKAASGNTLLYREVSRALGACSFALFILFFAPHACCAHPITRYLGEATYTIYLYHMVAIRDYSTDLNAAADPLDHREAWEIIAHGQPLLGLDAKRFLLGLSSSMMFALVVVAVLGNNMALRFFGVRLPFDPCGHRRSKHQEREVVS